MVAILLVTPSYFLGDRGGDPRGDLRITRQRNDPTDCGMPAYEELRGRAIDIGNQGVAPPLRWLSTRPYSERPTSTFCRIISIRPAVNPAISAGVPLVTICRRALPTILSSAL